MPSLVTLPFIQCHHTRGRAEFGGSRNCASRLDCVATGWSAASAAAGRSAVEASRAAAKGRRLAVNGKSFQGIGCSIGTGLPGRRLPSPAYPADVRDRKISERASNGWAAAIRADACELSVPRSAYSAWNERMAAPQFRRVFHPKPFPRHEAAWHLGRNPSSVLLSAQVGSRRMRSQHRFAIIWCYAKQQFANPHHGPTCPYRSSPRPGPPAEQRSRECDVRARHAQHGRRGGASLSF